MVIAACVAHVYAFLYALRRYVVGLPDFGNWQTMFTVPSWQPPLSWEGLTILFSVTLLIGGSYLYSFIFPGHKLIPGIPAFYHRVLSRVKRAS
jgi:hypothetical protein